MCIELNPQCFLISIDEAELKGQSLLSNLETEYLVHILLNNESKQPVFSRLFVADFKKYKQFLADLWHYRQKFSYLVDNLSPTWKKVDKVVIGNACKIFSQRVASSFFVDFLHFRCMEVIPLFNGSYYCRFENDTFGIANQIVRCDGKEYTFLIKQDEGKYFSPLILDNYIYQGVRIRDYFQIHNFRDCERKMLERMRRLYF